MRIQPTLQHQSTSLTVKFVFRHLLVRQQSALCSEREHHGPRTYDDYDLINRDNADVCYENAIWLTLGNTCLCAVIIVAICEGYVLDAKLNLCVVCDTFFATIDSISHACADVRAVDIDGAVVYTALESLRCWWTRCSIP